MFFSYRCHYLTLRNFVLLFMPLMHGALESHVLAQKASPAAKETTNEKNVALDQVLSNTQWQQLDQAVDKSLRWLAQSQQSDGSFPTHPGGQPGVTALCVMAFAAHGHLPGQGPYGEQLRQALVYINSCQKKSGLIALDAPNTEKVPRDVRQFTGTNAVYNHAISATVLSEMYGLAVRTKNQTRVIEQAIQASLIMQHWPKNRESERGGWRYLQRNPSGGSQSDLSVTAWELMFLRSAKNNGFEVPKKRIQEGVEYVLRTFNKEHKTFALYDWSSSYRSRAMAGAGIMALAHSGVHDRPEVKHAAEYILKNPCVPYGIDNPLKQKTIWYGDRYHYSAFLSSLAMYQIGGKFWAEHFPRTVRALVDNQEAAGSWQPEKHHYDSKFGRSYTTSLVVLTLGIPNQLLPVFQR